MGLKQVVFVFLIMSVTIYAKLCTKNNVMTVARVVFGESRGEPEVGQKAVAYTIVNRITHAGYPNTLRDVVYQKASNNRYQYETLDLSGHSTAWRLSQRQKDAEYMNAVRSAESALCNGTEDPTYCATDFCNMDPCASTSSNQYWEVFNKTQISGHFFVCRRPATAG